MVNENTDQSIKYAVFTSIQSKMVYCRRMSDRRLHTESFNDFERSAGSSHKADMIPVGDPQTFKWIWHRYQQGLVFLAQRIIGDQAAAEDIVTETFVRLWERVSRSAVVAESKDSIEPETNDVKRPLSFANEKAVAGWLRVATRNACFNLLKQMQGTEQRLQEMTTILQDIENEWNRDDLLAYRLQSLYAETEQLPDRGRTIFKMRYLEGLKNQDIADRLGITYETLANQLALMLNRLRLSLRHRQDLLLLLVLISGSKDMIS